MVTALEALGRLREGNRRFVEEIREDMTITTQTRRSELLAGQEPFAIILGCADSRSSAERFGTRLVVVLGHSQCGVVEAPLFLRNTLKTKSS